MMRYKIYLFLLPLLVFSSCKTINISRAELNIPPNVVYLSFDDGPNAHGGATERLLDTLKKYQISAIFCLLGENAERHPDLVRRMYDEGHLVISHGYFDKWSSSMGEDEFRDNLARGWKAISEALGFELNPKLYRPHGGFYNSAQEKIIKNEGYLLVPSNIRVYDAVLDGTKRNKVIKEVIKKVEKQGGGIVLLHDSRGSNIMAEKELLKHPYGAFDRSWIPDAVDEIIPVLLGLGVVFDNPRNLTIAERY